MPPHGGPRSSCPAIGLSNRSGKTAPLQNRSAKPLQQTAVPVGRAAPGPPCPPTGTPPTNRTAKAPLAKGRGPPQGGGGIPPKHSRQRGADVCLRVESLSRWAASGASSLLRGSLLMRVLHASTGWLVLPCLSAYFLFLGLGSGVAASAIPTISRLCSALSMSRM